MLKNYLNDEEGAAAFVFAIMIPVLIGGISLAVELGHWNQKKSKLQDLADVTAKAAAYEMMVLGQKAYEKDNGTEKYKLAGKGHAFENGFNFSSGVVSVLSPPPAGKYAGRTDMVEVTLTDKQDLYFAQYIGTKEFNLTTKATAYIVDEAEACILTLSPDKGPSVSIGGSAAVNLTDCAVHANSSAVNAIDVEDLTAACISSVGGIRTSNETVIDCPKVKDYSRTVRDPYADMSVPSNVSSMGCMSKGDITKINKWDIRVKPGRYCTNLVSNGSIYMDPGTYYFDDASLITKSQHSLVYGRGVTLVFMNGGRFGGANGGTISVTAPKPPTSEPFPAIAFYFDPATTPLDDWMTINGNQQSLIEGVFYAPNTNIKMNGTANSTSKCTQIVSYSAHFTGNAGFTNENCEALGAKQIGGLSGVALVE